jgi:hypothetical protein
MERGRMVPAQRQVEAHAGYVPAGQTRRRIVLKDQTKSIVSWFFNVGKLEKSPAEKERLWLGLVAHKTAASSTWRGKDDPQGVALLNRLVHELLEMVPLLEKFQLNWNTQATDAFQTLKVKREDKGTSWKTSHEVRVFVTALCQNGHLNWLTEFCEQTGIDLPEDVIEQK